MLIPIVLIFGTGKDLIAEENGHIKIQNHLISIELFPEQHGLKGKDKMLVHNPEKEIALRLNKNFEIMTVTVDGEESKFKFISPGGGKKLKTDLGPSDPENAGILKISLKKSGTFNIVVEYKGTVFQKPTSSRLSRQYVANLTSGIISKEGTFLSPASFWYPQGEEEMSLFEVHTTTPAGYETVTQGGRLEKMESSGSCITAWKNEFPSDGLYLQAGPYKIQEGNIDGISVYTYFYPGGENLASLYLQKSKYYIAMYNKLLGRYPYPKFAVVENFFETGYGMPSWTLLGKTVVRLPFIPDTSLPHEICHNWWGNGVFVDYTQGNWCEGLTVYCADYLLKKKKKPPEDMDYRLQTNRDYSSYVKKNKNFALTKFTSRHDPATRAVGYGKSMMVFHQLQRIVGEDVFFKALKSLMTEFLFKRAAWDDVLGVIKKESGASLEGFFGQWVERIGAPVIKLKIVDLEELENGYGLAFNILQEGESYNLNIPILFTTEEGKIWKDHRVEGASTEFRIFLPSKPRRMDIDPDHHIFRKLFPEEIPPSIAKVYGTQSQYIVVSSEGDSKQINTYRQAADMINRTRTAKILADKEISSEQLKERALIFLGIPAEKTEAAIYLDSIHKKSPWGKEMGEKEDSGSVMVFVHPEDNEWAIMAIQGKPGSDIKAVTRKLPHYGKYSYLLFHGETNVAKGIWEIESSPLIHVFD